MTQSPQQEDFLRMINFFKKEKYVVLFLYLMHYPDYPYNIGKTLGKISRKGISSLGRAEDVADFLNEMEKEGYVTHKIELSENKRKIKKYSINTSFLASTMEFKIYQDSIYVNSDEKSKIFIDRLVLMIQESLYSMGKDSKQETLKRLFEQFRNLDLITLLDYLFNLIRRLEGYFYAELYEEEDSQRIKKTEKDRLFSVINLEKLKENKDILNVNFSKKAFSVEEAGGIRHEDFRKASNHLKEIKTAVLEYDRCSQGGYVN